MADFPKKIIISRTDAIGDVILTLGLTGYIKEHFKETEIIFLGREYTRSIIELCPFTDHFISREDLFSGEEKNASEKLAAIEADAIIHVFPDKEVAKAAKKAKINTRIGTSHRSYHLFTCNKPVNFTRKRSDLHESQLNFKLLKPLGINSIPTLDELKKWVKLDPEKNRSKSFSDLFEKDKIRVAMHPKSMGSAREWKLEHYAALIDLLDKEKFQIFITGTEKEGEIFREKLINGRSHISDMSGKLSLNELSLFISECDAMVACSTGPLHIASACGVNAIGIYPPIRPMHPGRWSPVGEKASVFVADKECSDCRDGGECHCINSIMPSEVAKKLNEIVIERQ